MFGSADEPAKEPKKKPLALRPSFPVRFAKGLALFLLAPVVGPPKAVYQAIQKQREERAWKERARQTSERCKLEREREAAYYQAVCNFLPDPALPQVTSDIQESVIPGEQPIRITTGTVKAGESTYQVRYEKFENGPKFKQGEIQDSNGRKWTFALDEDDNDPRWGGFHNTQYTDEHGQVFSHRYNRAIMLTLNSFLERRLIEPFWQAVQPPSIQPEAAKPQETETALVKVPTVQLTETLQTGKQDQYAFTFI